MFLELDTEDAMSYFAITDAELDLGMFYAEERNYMVLRKSLRILGDHLLMLRQTEGLSFPAALRATLNQHLLVGDRREWYKRTLGKIFSSRNGAKAVRKGRVKRLPKPKPIYRREGIPTVLEGKQFAFALMRQPLKEKQDGTTKAARSS